jgi:hypothetical protein
VRAWSGGGDATGGAGLLTNAGPVGLEAGGVLIVGGIGSERVGTSDGSGASAGAVDGGELALSFGLAGVEDADFTEGSEGSLRIRATERIPNAIAPIASAVPTNASAMIAQRCLGRPAGRDSGPETGCAVVRPTMATF